MSRENDELVMLRKTVISGLVKLVESYGTEMLYLFGDDMLHAQNSTNPPLP